MESDSHLAVLDEILKVSHHSVIQQTWTGDLLGARHGAGLWGGDLNKYNTPWPQGTHIQPGFTEVTVWYSGRGRGHTEAPQPGQRRMEDWVREGFPQEVVSRQGYERRIRRRPYKSYFYPGKPGPAACKFPSCDHMTFLTCGCIRVLGSLPDLARLTCPTRSRPSYIGGTQEPNPGTVPQPHALPTQYYL